jgi:nitronate monooxygenase
MWPDRRIIDLFKTEFPILLAPMAGVMDQELAIAVAQGGGLASIPCAMIPADKAREQVGILRQRVSAPVNLNFFCHTPVDADPAREAGWKRRLAPYYAELGIDPAAPVNAANRAPFDEAMCALVEELKPEVVSFHWWRRRPSSRRRSGWSSMAPTSSSPRAPKPAAIAACS